RVPQQLAVRLAGDVAGVDADLFEVGLELQLEVALGREGPDRTCRRRQRLLDPLQEFVVVVGRRQLLFRQPGNFFYQAVDVLAGLLNQVQVNLRLRSYAHLSTSPGNRKNS